MSDTELVELTARTFGRELTSEVAPEELPYFDELAEATSSGQPLTQFDHDLGFGLGDAMSVALSATMLEVARRVAQFIWEHSHEAVGTVVRETSKKVAEHIALSVKDWLTSKNKTPQTIAADKLEGLLNDIRHITKDKLSDEQTEAVVQATAKFVNEVRAA